ncbi:MAG: PAS domain-containing sensor histidine kinase, partial [Candidatus Limnocylindria bacterium]
DQTGSIVLLNHQTEVLFGYPRDDLLGRPVEVLIPARYRANHPGHRSSYFANPHTRPMGGSLELSALRRDGTEFPVEISLSPITLATGVMAVATIRDVSERRRQGVALRETQRLKEMNEFRARFINMAAHELKTPLTPIRIQSRLLSTVLAKGMTPEQQRALTSLERNVDRLQRLVDDILDAARVQSTQLKLRRELLDATEVVSEAVESYRPVGHAVGVQLEWSPSGPLPVQADRQRLLQVVNNLLNNAIKFTHKDGRVRVLAEASDDHVELAISDTGRGMTAEQIARLFQPFTQVHGDPETTKGTGLGLFICKGIVEEHGGQIEATSEGQGHGATFRVRLPIAPGTPPPRPSAKAKSRVLEERIRELI